MTNKGVRFFLSIGCGFCCSFGPLPPNDLTHFESRNIFWFSFFLLLYCFVHLGSCYKVWLSINLYNVKICGSWSHDENGDEELSSFASIHLSLSWCFKALYILFPCILKIDFIKTTWSFGHSLRLSQVLGKSSYFYLVPTKLVWTIDCFEEKKRKGGKKKKTVDSSSHFT